MTSSLEEILAKNKTAFADVVVKQNKKYVKFDLSPANALLTPAIFESTDSFCLFVNQQLEKNAADFLYGGYAEHREIYRRSSLFDNDLVQQTQSNEEPRNIHLGIDIWGEADTPIFSPLNGAVHSFDFNDNFGDYGATIILEHLLDGRKFHTLYGHLSLKDINTLNIGDIISRGDLFCHFGPPAENGHWPPHLHFQIIEDMQGMMGDYPGVCKTSEKEKYLANCPNANLILGL